MQSAATKRSLFLTGSSLKEIVRVANAYGHASAQDSLKATLNYLTSVAREARLFGQPAIVQQAAESILSLPVSGRAHSIGVFYALCAQPLACEEMPSALERLADDSLPGHKERIIHEIGLTHFQMGHFAEAAPYLMEAAKSAQRTDIFVHAESLKILAVCNGILGEHSQALSALDTLWPAVSSIRSLYPDAFVSFLNSRAVELAALGRLDEAVATIRFVLRSGFSNASCKETAEEIAALQFARSYRSSAISVPGALDAGRLDFASDIEPLSATPISPRATDSRTEKEPDVDDPAPVEQIIEPEVSPATDRPKPSTLPSRLICWRVLLTVIARATALIQTTLAPSPGRSLDTASTVSGNLSGTPLVTYLSSRSAKSFASSCQTKGEPTENICAAGGYPKSPLARGPPRL